MTQAELLLLFAAGIISGMLNAVAGGGSFISFPALLFAGVPPISANATNTFAACSGYLSGTWAFRHDLKAHKKQLPLYVAISLAGGITGAWLLLQTPQESFSAAIPWLLLFASTLFICGNRLNQLIRRYSSADNTRHWLATAASGAVLLGVCIYGGFFNAGLGIIALSYLVLTGHTDINAMNGIKLLVSSCVSLIAIAIFIADGAIVWFEGGVLLTGSLLGGYFAAKVSRRIPQQRIRQLIIITSLSITAYFFADHYQIWPLNR